MLCGSRVAGRSDLIQTANQPATPMTAVDQPSNDQPEDQPELSVMIREPLNSLSSTAYKGRVRSLHAHSYDTTCRTAVRTVQPGGQHEYDSGTAPGFSQLAPTAVLTAINGMPTDLFCADTPVASPELMQQKQCDTPLTGDEQSSDYCQWGLYGCPTLTPEPEPIVAEPEHIASVSQPATVPEPGSQSHERQSHSCKSCQSQSH